MSAPKSLTKVELNSLLATARKHSESDYLMFLVTFNHGLRVSETLALTASNLVAGHLVVQRLKGSDKTTQPLLPDEKALLEGIKTEGEFFKMDRRTFDRKMKAYGAEAGIAPFKCHAHALKHSCGRIGYEGGMGIPELQTYLGHKNGGNTMIYLQADEGQAAAAFLTAVGGK